MNSAWQLRMDKQIGSIEVGKFADLIVLERDFLAVPVGLLGSQSAVRPIVKGRQALLGAHPSHPRVLFFNGLGSKGSLRAPWLARHLTEHLLDGRPLDSEFDLQANDPA